MYQRIGQVLYVTTVLIVIMDHPVIPALPVLMDSVIHKQVTYNTVVIQLNCDSPLYLGIIRVPLYFHLALCDCVSPYVYYTTYYGIAWHRHGKK